MKNVEIKARCADQAHVRAFLRERGARFVGTDEQTDTYFGVPSGRLKLRQGRIENALIYYRRPDRQAARRSDVLLAPAEDGSALHGLLEQALGILVEVRKTREIHFIGSTKFHIDTVEGLGDFVEIEVIDADDSQTEESLRATCEAYRIALGISEEDLVAESYSDLLLRRSSANRQAKGGAE